MTLRVAAIAVLTGALALAGCGKMGALERPGPLAGKGSGADAGSDPGRAIRTVDPRNRDDAPVPPRPQPIDSAPSATSSAPQGALPDPYARPR